MKGVIYVSNSDNKKLLGSKPVDSTYASIKATCPSTCLLRRDKSCYAMNSFVGMQVRKLDKRARQHSPLELARAEAQVIDASYRGGDVPEGRSLRLHVSGDSKVRAGSRLINSAVGRWKKRGGGDVWAYTHSWRNVPRNIWSNVSILASVDNIGQAKEARKNGYAPALVVGEHPSDKVYELKGSNIKWIPCVQQTREIGCSDCKLCFNANRLYEKNMGIAFAAHGMYKGVIKRRLTVLQ